MEPEAGWRMPPLEAGRQAAGLALLGWLDDAGAPRLARVTGTPGAGASHLLAWLVRGCTAEDAPSARRIHGLVPAAGLSLHGAVWMLAQQFQLVAHTAAELTAAIAADDRPTVICVPELDRAVEPGRLASELLAPLLELPHVRLLVESAAPGAPASVAEPLVLDLDDPRWTDREQFAQWCAGAGADPAGYPSPGQALGESDGSGASGGSRPSGGSARTAEDAAAVIARVPTRADGTRDLRAAGEDLLTEVWEAAAGVGALGPLAGDPVLYALARPTTVTAAVEGRDDTLARAWQAAGPGLIDESDPGERAAVLRTHLLGVDEAAAAELAAVPGRWAARWAARGRGTVELTAGSGPYASQLLVVDTAGTVRGYDAATGRRTGAVVVPGPKPLRGIALTSAATLVLLDAWGGTELVAAEQPRRGLEPFELTEAIEAVRESAEAELTAVAAIPLLVGTAPAFGDAAGVVHWADPEEVTSAPLHQGPVTALAGVALGDGGLSEPEIPLLVSGGLDGTVRLWGPASDPMPEPCDSRGCPVEAVAAGATAAGTLVAAAWSDGLVRVRNIGRGGEVFEFRLGSRICSMAFVGTTLALGSPDGLVAVDISRR